MCWRDADARSEVGYKMAAKITHSELNQLWSGGGMLSRSRSYIHIGVITAQKLQIAGIAFGG